MASPPPPPPPYSPPAQGRLSLPNFPPFTNLPSSINHWQYLFTYCSHNDTMDTSLHHIFLKLPLLKTFHVTLCRNPTDFLGFYTLHAVHREYIWTQLHAWWFFSLWMKEYFLSQSLHWKCSFSTSPASALSSSSSAITPLSFSTSLAYTLFSSSNSPPPSSRSALLLSSPPHPLFSVHGLQLNHLFTLHSVSLI